MARLLVAVGIALAGATLAVTEHSLAKNPARCPVTAPGLSAPNTGRRDAASFNYGTDKLRVHIWRRGILLAGSLPGGGVFATIESDGSVRAKVGWWRGVSGRLVITGRRLDGSALQLRAYVPNGYGLRGFQPTGLVFPELGCWRVVGTVGNARLAFVVKVRKVGRG